MNYIIVDDTGTEWLYLYKFDEQTGEPLFDKKLCRTFNQRIVKKAYFNAQRLTSNGLKIFPIAREAIVFQHPQGEQGCFSEQDETNNGLSPVT